MHKHPIIIVRPDGITAGALSRHELAEEISECRLKARQLRLRASAELQAASACNAGIGDIGGVTHRHPLVAAHLAALLKALSYTESANAFEGIAAALEGSRR